MPSYPLPQTPPQQPGVSPPQSPQNQQAAMMTLQKLLGLAAQQGGFSQPAAPQGQPVPGYTQAAAAQFGNSPPPGVAIPPGVAPYPLAPGTSLPQRYQQSPASAQNQPPQPLPGGMNASQ